MVRIANAIKRSRESGSFCVYVCVIRHKIPFCGDSIPKKLMKSRTKSDDNNTTQKKSIAPPTGYNKTMCLCDCVCVCVFVAWCHRLSLSNSFSWVLLWHLWIIYCEKYDTKPLCLFVALWKCSTKWNKIVSWKKDIFRWREFFIALFDQAGVNTSELWNTFFLASAYTHTHKVCVTMHAKSYCC